MVPWLRLGGCRIGLLFRGPRSGGSGWLRGIGGVFAGLVLLLAMVSAVIYYERVSASLVHVLREQQLLYERVLGDARDANFSGNVLMLPEPADVVVVDPHGTPHIALGVHNVKIPWGVEAVQMYVVRKNVVAGGFRHVVASSRIEVGRNSHRVASNVLELNVDELAESFEKQRDARLASEMAAALFSSNPDMLAWILNSSMLSAKRAARILGGDAFSLDLVERVSSSPMLSDARRAAIYAAMINDPGVALEKANIVGSHIKSAAELAKAVESVREYGRLSYSINTLDARLVAKALDRVNTSIVVRVLFEERGVNWSQAALVYGSMSAEKQYETLLAALRQPGWRIDYRKLANALNEGDVDAIAAALSEAYMSGGVEERLHVGHLLAMYELRNEKLAEIMSSRRFRIKVIMAELFMRDPLEEGRITIVSWRCGSDALGWGGVYEYDKENHLVRVHTYSGYGITSGVYGLRYRVNITVPQGSLLVLGGHGYDYYTWRTTRGKFFYIYEDNKYREMLSEALNQKLCSPESYACIAARNHIGNPMPAICAQAWWPLGRHRVWTLYRALILAPP